MKFEVHAGEIFQGSGPFRRWTRDHRLDLLRDSLNVFNDYQLPIIFGAIDKSRLKDQHSDLFPPGLAFTLCVEIIEEWFRANANDEIGMLICDETSERSEFKDSLKQYQRQGLKTGVKNLKLDQDLGFENNSLNKKERPIRVASMELLQEPLSIGR